MPSCLPPARTAAGPVHAADVLAPSLASREEPQWAQITWSNAGLFRQRAAIFSSSNVPAARTKSKMVSVVVAHGWRPSWVKGCPRDNVGSASGVPQIAADLLRCPSRQERARKRHCGPHHRVTRFRCNLDRVRLAKPTRRYSMRRRSFITGLAAQLSADALAAFGSGAAAGPAGDRPAVSSFRQRSPWRSEPPASHRALWLRRGAGGSPQ